MKTTALHVFAKWQVKEGLLDEVFYLLNEMAQKSREEKGNIFYRVHQSISDPNTIMIFEGYADEEALQAHKDSVHYQTLVAERIIPKLEKREVIITNEL